MFEDFLHREHNTTKTRSGFILVFIHNSFNFGDKTICQLEKEGSGTLCDFNIFESASHRRCNSAISLTWSGFLK